MIDVCVFFLLSVMIIARACVNEATTLPMNLCVYVSLLVALIVLYNNAKDIYGEKDNFRTIQGVWIVGMLIFAVLIVAILFNIWVPSTSANDIATLFALLFSLSQKLFIKWMGRYLNGE